MNGTRIGSAPTSETILASTGTTPKLAALVSDSAIPCSRRRRAGVHAGNGSAAWRGAVPPRPAYPARMARGRHVRRSRLWAWLFPIRRPEPSWRSVHAQSLLLLGDDLRALDDEVGRLRTFEERSTAAAVAAELRAERLERELAVVRAEVAALRRDVSVVREELVWAFAERRLPVEGPRVVDLTQPVADTA